MTTSVGVVTAALAIFVGVAYGVALASGPVYRAVERWLATLPATTRATLLLTWAAAPLVIGLAVLLVIFAPSIAHLLGVDADHCHVHGHHAHLCLVHAPLFTASLLEQLILGGTSIAVLGHTLTTAWRVRRGHRVNHTLLALGRRSAASAAYRVVDSQLPFAITAGLFRPRVLVSNRLLCDLSPSELATVLRHEQAHQRRRDGIRLFAAEAFSALHLREPRRLLLDALALASEQACDEVAATQSGDRLQVAATILKVARLVGNARQPPGWSGAAVTGSDVTRRVEALLRPAPPARSGLGAGAWPFAGLTALAGLATSAWWHHAAESLFAFWLG